MSSEICDFVLLVCWCCGQIHGKNPAILADTPNCLLITTFMRFYRLRRNLSGLSFGTVLPEHPVKTQKQHYSLKYCQTVPTQVWYRNGGNLKTGWLLLSLHALSVLHSSFLPYKRWQHLLYLCADSLVSLVLVEKRKAFWYMANKAWRVTVWAALPLLAWLP